MAHDRPRRDNLPLTCNIIAKMLGVRRAGVTGTVAAVEATGAIRSERGHLRVLDRPNFKAQDCDCYYIIRAAQNLKAQP